MRVATVRYHSSQSWPFPFQLMLGCYAVASPLGLTVTVDPHEMNDVQWFSKETVKKAISGDPSVPFLIPPPLTIAHQLIRRWVDGEVTDNGEWRE